MSQVFDGYERQYCEISANLSKKCSSVVSLDGEQKKQKLSEIKSGLENAEALCDMRNSRMGYRCLSIVHLVVHWCIWVEGEMLDL